jgi:DNA polymerase-1
MIALVDADSLVYKVGFAIEDKVVWNELELATGEETEPEVNYYTNILTCKQTFAGLVETILYNTGCDSAILVFTGKNNFRTAFPTSYKENRKASRKPEGFAAILQYAKDSYTTVIIDGIEADDYVVQLKTQKPDDYVLCAIDKDVLYQTEGVHYNYTKAEEVTTTLWESIYYAYFQTLAGDTTDGYKGCPQIGEKKATKLLKDLDNEKALWETVVAAYESKGLTEDDALWTMRLANMHQYDGTKVKLWNPP